MSVRREERTFKYELHVLAGLRYAPILEGVSLLLPYICTYHSSCFRPSPLLGFVTTGALGSGSGPAPRTQDQADRSPLSPISHEEARGEVRGLHVRLTQTRRTLTLLHTTRLAGLNSTHTHILPTLPRREALPSTVLHTGANELHQYPPSGPTRVGKRVSAQREVGRGGNRVEDARRRPPCPPPPR